MPLSVLASRRLFSPPTRELPQVSAKHLFQNCVYSSSSCSFQIICSPLTPFAQSKTTQIPPADCQETPFVLPSVAPSYPKKPFHVWAQTASRWQRCSCTVQQRSLFSPCIIMAKPVARWRRSGTRDNVGLSRGPDTSPPPGSSSPSDHQAPNMPRSFSSFRMQGVAPAANDSGAFPSREDGLQRAHCGAAPSGFSSQSPSSVGVPGETPRYTMGGSDGARGNFAPPVSPGPAGSDPQSATALLFGNRGLEAFNKLTLDDEYILHFYGVRQAVRWNYMRMYGTEQVT